MASVRDVWKNVLRFGLVNVPVRAYTAAEGSSGGGDIRLNQLHKECNSRIQYKKTCPIHGEVSGGDIVSGYEFSKEQYVVIDPEEIDKLRPQAEKAINIEAFVTADAVDPMYFSGSNYYLAPDGQPAAKPYAVLQRVMKENGRFAFATVVMRSRGAGSAGREPPDDVDAQLRARDA
jgi:DNA end-binding protein Ku